jgi:hypothetical protein
LRGSGSVARAEHLFGDCSAFAQGGPERFSGQAEQGSAEDDEV